jgi:hypothetical protein
MVIASNSPTGSRLPNRGKVRKFVSRFPPAEIGDLSSFSRDALAERVALPTRSANASRLNIETDHGRAVIAQRIISWTHTRH